MFSLELDKYVRIWHAKLIVDIDKRWILLTVVERMKNLLFRARKSWKNLMLQSHLLTPAWESRRFGPYPVLTRSSILRLGRLLSRWNQATDSCENNYLLWYLHSIRIVKLVVKHVKSPPKLFKHDFKKAEHEPAGLKNNLILFLRTYWVLPRHLMSKLGMFTLKIR